MKIRGEVVVANIYVLFALNFVGKEIILLQFMSSSSLLEFSLEIIPAKVVSSAQIIEVQQS